MAYAIVDAGEVEAQKGAFRALRQPLGLTAFGLNQIELPPGAEGPEHDHTGDGQEEVYAIIAGSGTIRVDGEDVPLHPGRFVFLPPEARRKMIAGDQGLTWIGIGCPPGAYVPRS